MRPDVAFALPALAGGGVERVYLDLAGAMVKEDLGWTSSWPGPKGPFSATPSGGPPLGPRGASAATPA